MRTSASLAFPARKAMVLALVALLAALGALLAVVRFAGLERGEPNRCPTGLIALGPRCCADGQRLRQGSCHGTPQRCADGMRAIDSGMPGCAVVAKRLAYPGATMRLGPADWQAEGVVAPREVVVQAFELDATEVMLQRWTACVAAGRCPVPMQQAEPGQPLVNVTPASAAEFCRFMGGRLPSSDEWLFAAGGSSSRRFPWGQTGLVCRRAAFGLREGPCADGAEGPELAGARPEGATPEGALDLSGNVAEWTREPDGSYVARGGSFRSRTASELVTWARESGPHPSGHIGFRCAYDPRQ
jgi:sulfatase modifying factor 1